MFICFPKKKNEGSQHFKIPGLVLPDNVVQVVGFQLVSLTLGSRFWQKVGRSHEISAFYFEKRYLNLFHLKRNFFAEVKQVPQYFLGQSKEV